MRSATSRLVIQKPLPASCRDLNCPLPSLRCFDLLLFKLGHQLFMLVVSHHAIEFLQHALPSVQILRMSPAIIQIGVGLNFDNDLAPAKRIP